MDWSRCCSMSLAHRVRLLAFLVFLEALRRSAAAARAACPMNVFQNIGAAQHRSGAVRVGGHHQDAALAEQTPAIRIGQRHAAEFGSPRTFGMP